MDALRRRTIIKQMAVLEMLPERTDAQTREHSTLYEELFRFLELRTVGGPIAVQQRIREEVDDEIKAMERRRLRTATRAGGVKGKHLKRTLKEIEVEGRIEMKASKAMVTEVRKRLTAAKLPVATTDEALEKAIQRALPKSEQ